MVLPHPEEKMAGCCWLPRHAAKIRLHLSSGLPFSYRVAVGSRIGVDGYFFRHFRLSLAQTTAAVKASPTDDALAAWFLGRRGVSAASIAEWNALAVKLGAKGHPAYWTLQIVRWVLYPKSIGRPVGGIFEAIAQDENLPPPSRPA